jgi:hypothetical protein
VSRWLLVPVVVGGFAAPAATAERCRPLPPPAGLVIEVTPGQAAELAGIVAGAPSGATIVLADGTYALGGALLHFSRPDVTLRSASGDRDAVVLDNDYAGGDLILIVASNVTVADVTVQRAWFHPIHVTPASSHVTGTLIHNVRVVDPGEQGIKINADGSQTLFADGGVVRCSRIELTDAGRPHIRNGCYTGGIDAHRARGWQIRDNVVEGFWCASGLSEHGIHVWTGSRDTVVERNLVRNCARGIGFGLGQATAGRTYPDNPCGGAASVGHFDGTIRNNVVFAAETGLFASASGFDSGIALEQACGARVLHNTVVSTQAPFSSMEGRFTNTVATFANNLMSHVLRTRDGAALTLAGNLQNAPANLFVDALATGDLHLVAAAAAAIDHGVALAAGQADGDLDAERREAARDIGADERRHDPRRRRSASRRCCGRAPD